MTPQVVQGIVGGAPVTASFAQEIGADGYSSTLLDYFSNRCSIRFQIKVFKPVNIM